MKKATSKPPQKEESSLISRVKEIYEDSEMSLKDKCKELKGAYLHMDANEDELYERYRTLKYKTEHSLSNLFSALLGAISSVFVSYAILFAEKFCPVIGLILIIGMGLLIVIVARDAIHRLKEMYMDKEMLLLYPLEIKLLEQRLLYGTSADASHHRKGIATPFE